VSEARQPEKPLGSCTGRCNCTKWGIVLRDLINRDCGAAATVYMRERGPRRFSRKLDSEDDEERLKEIESGAL
jgi:hypothetical protein